MLASLKVKDYMSANKYKFTPDMDILRAIHQMIEARISGAPVIDQRGNMIGFLSEKDCMQVALNSAYQQDGAAGQVSEYMTKNVDTIDVETPIIDVAELFLKGSYKLFPVITDNRLVGTITRQNILRALEDISTPDSGKKSAKQSTVQKIHV
ncbi:MAG: CBS domain-containing protein [Gammaproteobacteria bacterium]|nr:MAG: CBS domain-containing protein [Gammaproteobacteria bacterium]